MGSPPSWLDVLDRLLAGDRLAFMELNRLVTGLLTRQRVHDLSEDWDDLRQEVVIAVVTAARAGRLRDPDAFLGFVRAIVRNKVADRLDTRYRTHEKQRAPIDDVADQLADDSGRDAEDAVRAATLWRAVGDLPAEEAAVVRGVYAEGKTYETVAAETGIPLGTMKRRLRDGLAALRRRFAESAAGGDPIGAPPETSSKKGGAGARRVVT
jgi:RNA polymerase sigma-70 factor (ECF subfamily)